jgi:cytochrome bd ubiquinol oxidase subunit II
MVLKTLPFVFMLAGLALYAVLAGADFGAGFWQLFAGRGERAERIREAGHDAMAPVWEANHVWLIFVLTVGWTAYPPAVGAVASTLAVPLTIAAIGITARGTAYVLRSGAESRREAGLIDTIFSLSSIVTPFALGAIVGAIASKRVPQGNAGGDLFSSWLNPTAVLVGVLAVTTAAYLAAVFLAADARRLGDLELQEGFRRRALGSGLVAGAVSLAGLAVLHSDAHELFHQLVAGRALPALIVSVAAGVATLALVQRRAYESARYTAALAVAAVIAGWGLGQWPTVLPGLTVSEAAASHNTLVAVIVAVLAGAVLLFPSLALLFALTLKGRLEGGAESVRRAPAGQHPAARSATLTRAAAACLIAGFLLLTVADAGSAHAVGVVALFGFMACAFVALVPVGLAAD